MNKAISLKSTSFLIGCSCIQSSTAWHVAFLIYFTYTCNDIHIISSCNALTPDPVWFIQTILTNLHSYHARMGRACRQWPSVWPKQVNTQERKKKTRVQRIKRASSMGSVIWRGSDLTGTQTLTLRNLWDPDIVRSVQQSCLVWNTPAWHITSSTCKPKRGFIIQLSNHRNEFILFSFNTFLLSTS